MYIPQFWGGTESPDVNCGVTVSDYIPFETTINLALLYGVLHLELDLVI